MSNSSATQWSVAPPGSSVHGISQARILEWVAISFSKGSSQPRGWTQISCIGWQILHHWTTWVTTPYPSPNSTSHQTSFSASACHALSASQGWHLLFFLLKTFYLAHIMWNIPGRGEVSGVPLLTSQVLNFPLPIRSDQISHSVMSDSLRPHEL